MFGTISGGYFVSEHVFCGENICNLVIGCVCVCVLYSEVWLSQRDSNKNPVTCLKVFFSVGIYFCWLRLFCWEGMFTQNHIFSPIFLCRLRTLVFQSYLLRWTVFACYVCWGPFIPPKNQGVQGSLGYEYNFCSLRITGALGRREILKLKNLWGVINLMTGIFGGKKLQNFIDGDKHYFQRSWEGRKPETLFPWERTHCYYLRDRMFVDYSLDKLCRGFIFDEM